MTMRLNPRLIKLVEILNDGQYHEGNELGQKLDITRSAVWKAIKKLVEYGIKIHSQKSKGYILNEPMILLDPQKIAAYLSKSLVLNYQWHLLESVNSTNDFIKKQTIKNKIRHVCLAEHQTSGKGRFSRPWYSPFAQNIYFSVNYHFNKDVSELAGLSLVISLAVLSTLKSFSDDKKLILKWPNDILYLDQKLAGILVEINAESHGQCEAIIGIGINVNMQNDAGGAAAINQQWTSMRQILNAYIDRNLLVARLIENLTTYLIEFSTQGFSPFMSQWHQNDGLLNHAVMVKNGDYEIGGIALGVNQQGQLLLQHQDQAVATFAAGDVSLRRS